MVVTEASKEEGCIGEVPVISGIGNVEEVELLQG